MKIRCKRKSISVKTFCRRGFAVMIACAMAVTGLPVMPAQAEETQADVIAEGMIAYYDFEDAGESPTTVANKVGDGSTYTGTLLDVASLGTQDGWNGGTCLDLTQSKNDGLSIPSIINTKNQQDYSISMWYKRTNTTNTTKAILAQQTDNSPVTGRSLLYIDADAKYGTFVDQDNSKKSTTALTAGSDGYGWQHITWVFDYDADSTSYKVIYYVNGVNDGEISLNTDSITGSGITDLYIGRHKNNDDDTNLNGYVDEVRVYDCAVSADQAKAIYDYNDLGARGITVTVPTKTDYIVGDTLDLTGLAVAKTYNNGSSVAVTDYTTDADTVDMTTAGTKAVTVTYEGYTATFDIVVNAVEVSGITVTAPTKTTYYVGDTLDLAGLAVAKTYNNGSSVAVTDYTTDADKVDMNVEGEKIITVTYEGKTATFTVTVNEAVVSHVLEHVQATPATCTEAGNKEYWKCNACEKYFSDENGANEITENSWIIPATGHKITEKLTNPTDTDEGSLVKSCDTCGFVQESYVLPRKQLTITLGKSTNIISDSSKCTFEVAGAKKYKKYFALDTKTGKIKTKKNYSKKIKKSIPVKVTTAGQTYTVKVKLEIAAPKIKITKKAITLGGIKGYIYRFSYNIKGAKKIKVRVKGLSSLNKACDKYLSTPKSNSESYLNLKETTVKKAGGKLKFEIVAYYGKNISKKKIITK